MFLAIFGMCETNAMKAYRAALKKPMTRFQWLVELSDKLINNPYLPETGDVDGDDADG